MLRSWTGGNSSFLDFLHATNRQLLFADENQLVPLARLVQDLAVPRDPRREPLCQVAFAMQRVPSQDPLGLAALLIGQSGHTVHMSDMLIETVDLARREAPHELSLTVEEAGGNVYGLWQYNRDVFNPKTVSRLSDAYLELLGRITRDPLTPFSDLLPHAGAARRAEGTWPIDPTVAPKLHPRGRPDPPVFVAPRTATERHVASVWEDSLNVRPIGIHDNFFALGGHSLKAVELLAQLGEQYCVEVSLRAFLEAPQVEQLSQLIDDETGSRVLTQSRVLDDSASGDM